MIKLFPSLKSFFLSLKTDEKNEMESAITNNRLIAAFKHPPAEAMSLFLLAALTPLINLSLLLQRSDPLIQALCDALFTCVKQLLSSFVSPELARKFTNGDVTIVQTKGEILKDRRIF